MSVTTNTQAILLLTAHFTKAKEESDLAPQPNSDTGEVPLRVGIAQSILDKKSKKEEVEIFKRRYFFCQMSVEW